MKTDLRGVIFKKAKVSFEPYTADNPKTEHIVTINLNDLMKLIDQHVEYVIGDDDEDTQKKDWIPKDPALQSTIEMRNTLRQQQRSRHKESIQ